MTSAFIRGWRAQSEAREHVASALTGVSARAGGTGMGRQDRRMTSSSCLGARGRQGDAGGGPDRAARHPPRRDRRPVPRGGARRLADRPRGAPLHGARPARARRDHDRDAPRPARGSPMPVDGVILDGFPRNRPQAEALDAALAARGSRVDRALYIDVPDEELVRRLSGRWICQQAGHVYNEHTNPPRVPGRLRPRRLAAHPARRRPARHHPGAAGRPARRAARGRRPLRRTRRPARRSTDASRSTPSPPTSWPRLSTTRMRARPDWSPASRAPRSSRCAGPAASSPRSSTSSRPSSSPASRPPTSTQLAEAHIREAGAMPSFKGYPGVNPRRPFPASVCISHRRRDRPRHPRRADHQEGQIVSVDAGAILDGWHGDGARTFFVGEPPPAVGAT